MPDYLNKATTKSQRFGYRHSCLNSAIWRTPCCLRFCMKKQFSGEGVWGVQSYWLPLRLIFPLVPSSDSSTALICGLLGGRKEPQRESSSTLWVHRKHKGLHKRCTTGRAMLRNRVVYYLGLDDPMIAGSWSHLSFQWSWGKFLKISESQNRIPRFLGHQAPSYLIGTRPGFYRSLQKGVQLVPVMYSGLSQEYHKVRGSFPGSG